jgi:uncharacterized protein YdiU (UPF0061 family)
MQQFKPNKKQLKLLETMLDIEVSPTISDVCSVAGIDRSTYYRWMNNPEFKNWFNLQWREQVLAIEPILDKVCLNKAQNDFRYLKLIQEKYFTNKISENLGNKRSTEEIAKLLQQVLTSNENG